MSAIRIATIIGICVVGVVGIDAIRRIAEHNTSKEVTEAKKSAEQAKKDSTPTTDEELKKVTKETMVVLDSLIKTLQDNKSESDPELTDATSVTLKQALEQRTKINELLEHISLELDTVLL